MKKIFILIVYIIILANVSSAQAPGPAKVIRFGTADPATCQPSGANIFYNTSTHLLKICIATNTWQPLATSGGVITGSGTANNLPKFTTTTNVGDSIFSQGANNIDFAIGEAPSDFFIDASVADSLMRIGVGGRVINIGDRDGQGNGTSLEVNDVNTTISLGAWDGTAVAAPTNTINLNANTVILGDVGDNANHSKLTLVDSAQTATFSNYLTITLNGNIVLDKTNAAGTGAQTINKTSGSVNFAAAATSLVVTNSLVTTSSIIQCTVATNDTTMKSAQCVPGTGSFTIFANAAATGTTKVNWLVTN